MRGDVAKQGRVASFRSLLSQPDRGFRSMQASKNKGHFISEQAVRYKANNPMKTLPRFQTYCPPLVSPLKTSRAWNNT
jgi:hypothetical protein